MVDYRIVYGIADYRCNCDKDSFAISDLENKMVKYMKAGFKPLGSPVHLKEGYIIQAVYRVIPSSTEEEK